jgi:AcrR family transcriptional regulator
MSARPNLLKGETIPAEPTQDRSLKKHEKLKIAALELFGERGYAATAIQAIARRARLAVGAFYQHFRSKRQLLLVLMDELLEGMSQLDLNVAASGNDARPLLRGLLAAAFSRELKYLGVNRAWREAALSDPDLARKEAAIHSWTTARIAGLFQQLQTMPGARPGVDIPAPAEVMDNFFWSLLARAHRMPRAELDRWIEVSTHLIFHALFQDAPDRKVRRAK